jgi:tryptophan 2,3-dioxygenase
MRTTQPLTYASYLKVDDLVRLQQRLTGAHDELQFIVVHQVFELWFKLLLFELESVRDAIGRDDVPTAIRLLVRAQEIVKTLTMGWAIIETMRPIDFLEFRSELKPASGFQSRQFREIEFLCGTKDARYLRAFDDDPADAAALRRRLDEPSIWDALVSLLRARGFPVASDGEILQSVIRIQRRAEMPDLYDLGEALVEYDLLFSAWRQRHVLMTERMIGGRPGTGEATVEKIIGAASGSPAGAAKGPPGGEYFSGVHYLKTTVTKRFFPLLWEARTFVER